MASYQYVSSSDLVCVSLQICRHERELTRPYRKSVDSQACQAANSGRSESALARAGPAGRSSFRSTRRGAARTTGLTGRPRVDLRAADHSAVGDQACRSNPSTVHALGVSVPVDVARGRFVGCSVAPPHRRSSDPPDPLSQPPKPKQRGCRSTEPWREPRPLLVGTIGRPLGMPPAGGHICSLAAIGWVRLPSCHLSRSSRIPASFGRLPSARWAADT